MPQGTRCNRAPAGDGGGGNGGSLPPPSSGDPDPNHDSIDGTDIMTAPIMRLNTIGKLQDLLELGRFDSPKMEWLRKSASADQIFDLYNFIREEQESEEAKAFGKEAIDAFMNGGEVDIKARLINNPNLHDFLKNRMSPNELALFENLSIIQKTAYLRAAAEAYTYAEIFYPQPVRNRKGDAVKHTLWNALSTNYIGASLTKQLTDAHEEIPYDYPNHYKETNMDLFNNSKGRELATQYGNFIFQLIEEALENGDLRYLSNLEWSQTTNSWLATNSSQLISTDA
ncbi:hypothetical protein SAMN05444483_12710 [Salegentibacter echinorum]|uniref:DUF6973 domain-containing protein n=1 Tax=Salegentibacter echinorum TaxID=1073325 RepID=A0A1M5MD30_SALEC|nr:hypothetical protein [Salegentibacter echinorum]SHG75157.1 hypothetical protein SAMN05444483_12710 [Salegentibacter echinorum]